MSTATTMIPTETPEVDPEASSRALHRRLGADGRDRDAAITELHGLLLSAARFEVNRRLDSLPQRISAGQAEDLAQQSADDALLAVLGKLDDFRGESRFTTWAYKFALLEAGVKMRRRAWHGREIPLEDDAWARLGGVAGEAERKAEDGELFAALREEIEGCLTERQRQVLVAVALNDVPIDVLAERLDSNRGALYKTLHDARRKLRQALARRGFAASAHEQGTDR